MCDLLKSPNTVQVQYSTVPWFYRMMEHIKSKTDYE